EIFFPYKRKQYQTRFDSRLRIRFAGNVRGKGSSFRRFPITLEKAVLANLFSLPSRGDHVNITKLEESFLITIHSQNLPNSLIELIERHSHLPFWKPQTRWRCKGSDSDYRSPFATNNSAFNNAAPAAPRIVL